MTSKRHISPTRVPDDRLLDAARVCVLADGVRRTTLTAVARAAQVSRMTLYRRFPDVRTLVAALMTREFGALLGRIQLEAPTGVPTRTTLVDGLVRAASALSADPLMRVVLEADTELLTPYLFHRIGGTQRIAEEFLLAQLAAGHADGSVRRADPATQARALFLLVRPFALSMTPSTVDVKAADLLAELTHVLDAALRPGRV